MAALTDEQRRQLRGIADGSAVSITVTGGETRINDNPRAVVDAALARIDELERQVDECAHHTGSMISISHALQQAEDRVAELETENAEIERLRGDVRDLRDTLEGAPLHHGFMCGWCNGHPPKHEDDCAYVAILARTAVKP